MARRAARPVSDVLFAGLLAFLVFEYIRPGLYLPILDVVKLNTLIPVGVFLCTLLSKDGRPNDVVLRVADWRWFGALIVLMLIQFMTANVRMYVYDILKITISYLIISYVILRQVTSIQRLKVFMGTLVFLHILLVGLYPDVIVHPETRAYLAGTFLGDGNEFAWSACIALPFAIFLVQEAASKTMKILFLGAVVVLLIAVIGTQSRGGTLALCAMAIYLAVRSKRKLAALAGLGVLIGVVLMFAPDAYFDRMATVKEYETEGSAQGRILAWKTAVSMAMDHPLTGVGAGHFAVMFGFKYRPDGYSGPHLNAHSIYFRTLGEFGFPGMVILLGLILGNMVRNERLLHVLRVSDAHLYAKRANLIVAMQLALIGYAVAGAFLSGLFYPHLFILTALMASARFVVAREHGGIGARRAKSQDERARMTPL